jgi:hypothetical protein
MRILFARSFVRTIVSYIFVWVCVDVCMCVCGSSMCISIRLRNRLFALPLRLCYCLFAHRSPLKLNMGL